jgi:hypothetical protein
MTRPSPEPVLADLREAWGAALGDRLLGLYLHGSLVAGDFAADRSDLDLLAVLTTDPDGELLAELAVLHAGLDRRHPRWAGRIEVEYISLSAVPGVDGHRIARISPGEDLHLLPATTHRLVTWSAVRASGRPLLGPPPADLLPPIDPGLVREAFRDHVRDWPQWVKTMTTPGAQAYAVLTLCRAIHHLRYGRQLSKRQAADQTDGGQWSDLIRWARDWWYHQGRDTDPGRPQQEVERFVTETSADLLGSPPWTSIGYAPPTPPSPKASSTSTAPPEPRPQPPSSRP